jgi:hypothetical protein
MLERLGDRISLLGKPKGESEAAAEGVPEPASEAPVTPASEEWTR